MPDRMDPEQAAGKPDKAFEIGVRLFDEQRFWEAHEFFEYVWKCHDVEPGNRNFWRGITQVAVGFCHAQRGNAPGAVTLLNRATGNLEGYPSPHLRVHTRRLRGLATRVSDEIQARGNAYVFGFPRFPIVVPSS
jgi:predicted metal-dependent hydrolase